MLREQITSDAGQNLVMENPISANLEVVNEKSLEMNANIDKPIVNHQLIYTEPPRDVIVKQHRRNISREY